MEFSRVGGRLLILGSIEGCRKLFMSCGGCRMDLEGIGGDIRGVSCVIWITIHVINKIL